MSNYCFLNKISLSSFINNDYDSLETTVEEMQTNFQDGVDSIYNALISVGSTPDSTDITDIIASICSITTYEYAPTYIPLGTFTSIDYTTSWNCTISASVSLENNYGFCLGINSSNDGYTSCNTSTGVSSVFTNYTSGGALGIFYGSSTSVSITVTSKTSNENRHFSVATCVPNVISAYCTNLSLVESECNYSNSAKSVLHTVSGPTIVVACRGGTGTPSISVSEGVIIYCNTMFGSILFAQFSGSGTITIIFPEVTANKGKCQSYAIYEGTAV